METILDTIGNLQRDVNKVLVIKATGIHKLSYSQWTPHIGTETKRGRYNYLLYERPTAESSKCGHGVSDGEAYSENLSDYKIYGVKYRKFVEPERTQKSQSENLRLTENFAHDEIANTKSTRVTKKQNVHFYFIFIIVTTML